MAALASERDSWKWWCALGALALLSWSPVKLEDTWFYASTGRWVVDHHSIPRTDPFSWTVAGRDWQSNGWLWGVLLWGLWSLGRFVAVAALKPVFVLVCGLVLRWAAEAFGARRTAAMIGSLLGVVGTFAFLVERPQMASYVAAPVALVLTHRMVRDRSPWAWAIALFALFALWTNLHSVALSAVPLVAAVGVGAALDRRSERSIEPWLRAAGATAAAGLGTVVNPWGPALWTHASEVRSVSRGTISEWEPLWNRGAGGWIALAVVVAVVAAALRFGGFRRLELLLPLLGAAVLAVDAIRSFPIFVVVAATVVPPLVPTLVAPDADRRRMLGVGAGCALGISLLIAVPRIASTDEPSSDTPVEPVAALPAGCRLLNDYAFGNWVMFDRPDVPVSDDGRNDLYGSDGERFLLVSSSGAAEQLPAWVVENDVDCALLRPDSPARDVLTDAGWVVLEDDGNAVALTRP